VVIDNLGEPDDAALGLEGCSSSEARNWQKLSEALACDAGVVVVRCARFAGRRRRAARHDQARRTGDTIVRETDTCEATVRFDWPA
jgi:hypothetical protein